MRRKHKIFYIIDSLNHCWYQNGKWLPMEKLDQNKGYKSGVWKNNFKAAVKCALSHEGKVRLTKIFYKKGIRYLRETIIRPIND